MLPPFKTVIDHIKEKASLCWHPIYCNIVALLVQEYADNGWGPVDEKAMEGIINKAKAVADLHYKVAIASV
jgi:hypothetical protein